jgi:tripartite-type tricarboxylate transporter receptor subunit TctC
MQHTFNLLAFTLMGVPLIATAQSAADYPVKPVRVIVPTATGAATDLQARLLAQKLSASFKRSFVIENRTGAGYTAGYERNNRPNAANRAEETLRTSLWQSGTRRC